MPKFNRFDTLTGTYVSEIYGQSRFGYSISDSTDFYDMIEWSKKGEYQGSYLTFYDYATGKLFVPFQKQTNVLYGSPVYIKDYFWFLQGDYNIGKFTLYRYFPGGDPIMITQLEIEEVEPYNLRIMGEDVHIISQGEVFCCYYPEKFQFPMGEHEGAILIADGKVYLSAWVEEGWDEENDCASDDYQYYEKLIVRDFEGNLLSEEIGALNQHPDGSWWIA